MRTKEKHPTVRFQADLPPVEAAFLESVKAELGVNSNAKLLTEAASILKWILAERQSGRKIASVQEGTPVRELVSAVVECATFAQSPPYADLKWTPRQLQRIHTILSQEAAEPSAGLIRAISGA